MEKILKTSQLWRLLYSHLVGSHSNFFSLFSSREKCSLWLNKAPLLFSKGVGCSICISNLRIIHQDSYTSRCENAKPENLFLSLTIICQLRRENSCSNWLNSSTIALVAGYPNLLFALHLTYNSSFLSQQTPHSLCFPKLQLWRSPVRHRHWVPYRLALKSCFILHAFRQAN